MYSPKWLFLIPGLIILILSIIGFGVLSVKMLYLKNIGIDIHTLTYLGFAIILSYQIILFALLSKFYAVNQGLIPVKHRFIKIFKTLTLEKGLVAGLILFFAGLLFSIILFKYWADKDFGNITDFSHTFRLLIPSVILMALGIQTIFSSFILRIIGIIQHVVFLDDEKNQDNTQKK